MTDLRELKSVLDIPSGDTSEDKNLLFFIEQASQWISELLNRDFTFKTRTQYYQGTGTQKLLLRNRPVYPNPAPPYSSIQIIYDENGFFGTASGSFGYTSGGGQGGSDGTAYTLVYGQDYALQIDQDDGGSRSAILWRLNDYWLKPLVRQTGLLSPFVGPDPGSYQVTYTGGFTVDTLPPVFRQACNLLVAKMRYVFPLGIELGNESYEERSIGTLAEKKNYMLGLVMPMLISYRNWKW